MTFFPDADTFPLYGRNDGLEATTGAEGEEFLYPTGFCTPSTTESEREMRIPGNYRILKIGSYVTNQDSLNVGTILRKNGTGTGLSTGHDSGWGTASGEVELQQGDRISIRFNLGYSTDTDQATIVAWGFLFETL
jgi:hypothetical protein